MRPLVPVVAVLLLTACPESQFVEPPPSLDINVVLPEKVKVFAEVGNARLEFDPTTKDAIVALGLCMDAVTYCYQPGTKELSWCLANTRSCTSNQPWTEKPCCPQKCKDEFERAVKKGLTPAKAFEQVFFDDKDCFPGVREALEVTP